MRLFIPLFLIIAFGFAIYANVINGKFIWDDNLLIAENAYVKNFSGIKMALSRDIGSGSGSRFGYYRPLQLISYMFEYAFFGSDPRIYHITNILLHLLVALGVFWLATVIYGNRLFAFLSAMLFVAHPLQTETVAYISDRADLLCALFFVIGFIFYLKYIKSKSSPFYLVATAGYTLALFSKENALGFIPILLIYHYVFREKLNIMRLLPIAAITATYLVLRSLILNPVSPDTAVLSSIFTRLPGFFVAVTNYLRLLFLPYGLHFDYGNKIFYFLDFRAISGAILYFLFIIYAIMNKGKDAVVSFGILWFIIMLMPNSGIYPVTAFYMAEHYLYLPFIGFSFVLSKYLVRVYNPKASKITFAFIVSALIILYGYLTVRQNNYWIKPMDFYRRTLYFTPDSAEIYYNLASEYDRINNKGVAIALYKKSIDLDPGFDKAYNSLGVIYSKLNRKDEALILFKKALDLNPQSANICNNLGILYYELGKKDESFVFFKKAFQINPDYPVVLYNLAVAYYYRKEYLLSGEYCDKAIRLGYKGNPDFIKALKLSVK
jgi:hypothetical protein